MRPAETESYWTMVLLSEINRALADLARPQECLSSVAKSWLECRHDRGWMTKVKKGLDFDPIACASFVYYASTSSPVKAIARGQSQHSEFAAAAFALTKELKFYSRLHVDGRRIMQK